MRLTHVFDLMDRDRAGARPDRRRPSCTWWGRDQSREASRAWWSTARRRRDDACTWWAAGREADDAPTEGARLLLRARWFRAERRW